MARGQQVVGGRTPRPGTGAQRGDEIVERPGDLTGIRLAVSGPGARAQLPVEPASDQPTRSGRPGRTTSRCSCSAHRLRTSRLTMAAAPSANGLCAGLNSVAQTVSGRPPIRNLAASKACTAMSSSSGWRIPARNPDAGWACRNSVVTRLSRPSALTCWASSASPASYRRVCATIRSRPRSAARPGQFHGLRHGGSERLLGQNAQAGLERGGDDSVVVLRRG